MRFAIEHTGKLEDRLLTYVAEEYAFDIDPVVQFVSFSVVLNTLNLTVVDHNVVEVWGYCPHGGWLHTDHNVPMYAPGELQVLTDLEPGFSYRINDKDWPVYVNIQTGWVCIGDPQKPGRAVEFIHNCVAVVDNNQNLTALWLKPQSLPEL